MMANLENFVVVRMKKVGTYFASIISYVQCHNGNQDYDIAIQCKIIDKTITSVMAC